VPIYRVQLWLRQADTEWSETYYVSTAPRNLIGVASLVYLPRLELLAKPARLDRATCWDVATPRLNARFQVKQDNDYLFNPGGFAALSNLILAGDPDAALVIRWQTAEGTTRLMPLSGIPDQFLAEHDSQGLGVRTVQPVLLSERYRVRVRRFAQILQGPDMALMLRVRQRPPAVSSAVVVGIDVDPSGRFRLTTAGPHAFRPGQRLQYDGPRGGNITRLRGVRRVTLPVTPTTLCVDRGPDQSQGPVRYIAPGSVIGVGWTYAVAQPGSPFFEATFRHRGGTQPTRRGRARARRT
jgi:hypothetical protein